VHRAVRFHDVKRLHPIALAHAGKKLGSVWVLKSERAELAAIELQDASEDDLADPTVGVVQDPGLSRAAA
jgi:hypothetical protein